jgi:hypothetical protein
MAFVPQLRPNYPVTSSEQNKRLNKVKLTPFLLKLLMRFGVSEKTLNYIQVIIGSDTFYQTSQEFFYLLETV